MWGEFVRGLLVAICLLYGPGYFFFRSVRVSPLLAVCAAPLFCTCFYAGLPVVYSFLGIGCTVLSVGLPTALVALLSFAVSRALQRRSRKTDLAPAQLKPITLCGRKIPFDIAMPMLLAALASAVCIFVFVCALPGAGAFSPRFDNQTHLNVARAFVDSGDWSSLHASAFGASPLNECPFVTTGSFYPCGWTCVVALTCLGAGIDLMVAINVVVALAAALVFPLGMYAFLRVLFPQNRRMLMLCAFAITGFATWPWLFFYSGPLFPNQLGISLQYGALAVALSFVESRELKTRALCFSAFLITSFFALALTHPTTIFSCYVFFATYGAHLLLRAHTGKKRVAVMAIYTFAIVAFWLLCYRVPALAAVIGYSELGQSDLAGTLVDLFGMSFFFTCPQLILAALSLVGLVVVLKKRVNRWLLLPLCFFALGYVCACVDWWPGKHYIAAFWYSDWRRMAVNLIFYLMPLVALGLDALLPQNNCPSNQSPALRRARTALTALLLALVFVPNVAIPFTGTWISTPFGMAHDLVEERYHETIYGPEEVDFVNRAMQAIPPNALVINAPADGSMWAYGVNGIKTFYRSIQATAQTNEAQLIRKHLNEYATNQEVRAAVNKTNAQYVLLLDKDVPYEQGQWLWQYGKEQIPDWAGITDMDDNTPGFSVVLSEGSEMRLYKIER